MASISKRQTTRGDRYDVRHRAPSGRVVTTTFRTRRDAERHATTAEADKLRGAWIDPRAGRVTVGEYVERWQTSRVHRPTTAAQLDSHLRQHILPTFGDRPLAAVRRSEVQAFVKVMSDRLAPTTVEVVYRHLASIFRAAVGDQLLVATPCTDIALPKRERRPVEPLDVNQVHALADAVPDRHRALVLLAAGTGLRQGEAFGLRLPRVNVLRRSLEVAEQLVLLPGGPPFLGPPKTDASYRTIPLPQVVVDELAVHLATWPPASAAQLVFTNDAGQPISRTRFSEQVWQPAARAVGLAPRTGFHALRHFYASALIRAGESVKVVQVRLGHATAAETLDTYSHLWPDSEDRTRDALDRVLRETTAGPVEAVEGGMGLVRRSLDV